jgi:uncharacterized membrane protein YdjX (TVP38/TMEM64 family)
MKRRLFILILTALLTVTALITVDFNSLANSVNFFMEQSFFLSAVLFIALYLIVTVLALPGAALLSLSAGMIFGLRSGVVIVIVASGLSAVASFLFARYLLRGYVEKKFASTIIKLNAGIKKEGALYLFFLRIVPGIPFPVLNMSFGLTRMKLFTYWWISQLAMLPLTFLFVNAGTGIEDISAPAGILTVKTITSLIGIGIIPLLFKHIHSRIKTEG